MVGSVLRQARKEAGLSQEELAFRADVHRTYVSMLERDVCSPSLDVLFRLCDVLGLPASVFVARVEESKKEKPPKTEGKSRQK